MAPTKKRQRKRLFPNFSDGNAMNNEGKILKLETSQIVWQTPSFEPPVSK